MAINPRKNNHPENYAQRIITPRKTTPEDNKYYPRKNTTGNYPPRTINPPPRTITPRKLGHFANYIFKWKYCGPQIIHTSIYIPLRIHDLHNSFISHADFRNNSSNIPLAPLALLHEVMLFPHSIQIKDILLTHTGFTNLYIGLLLMRKQKNSLTSTEDCKI